MICCIGFGKYRRRKEDGGKLKKKREQKNTAMEYNINCMFKSHGSISFLEAIKMCRLYHRINLYNNKNFVMGSYLCYNIYLRVDSHINITTNYPPTHRRMIEFSEKCIAMVLCFMNLSHLSIFSIQHICDCGIE